MLLGDRCLHVGLYLYLDLGHYLNICGTGISAEGFSVSPVPCKEQVLSPFSPLLCNCNPTSPIIHHLSLHRHHEQCWHCDFHRDTASRERSAPQSSQKPPIPPPQTLKAKPKEETKGNEGKTTFWLLAKENPQGGSSLLAAVVWLQLHHKPAGHDPSTAESTFLSRDQGLCR